MTDLVLRLREASGYVNASASICREAADEIVELGEQNIRLRAALRGLIEETDRSGDHEADAYRVAYSILLGGEGTAARPRYFKCKHGTMMREGMVHEEQCEDCATDFAALLPHCPKCGKLYIGRGGQQGLSAMLSCPNGHLWADPRGGINE